MTIDGKCLKVADSTCIYEFIPCIAAQCGSCLNYVNMAKTLTLWWAVRVSVFKVLVSYCLAYFKTLTR